MFYFSCGDKIEDDARSFVGEVTELMRAHAGSNKKLAVDKIMVAGL
ncbi:MAG TPA: peptidase M24, partial [Rhodobacteraceae bacterium]|nr:peptidase M24 [Paracoccaceae bacterium]